MLYDFFVVAVHFINQIIVFLEKFVDLIVDLLSIFLGRFVVVFHRGVVCLIIIKKFCHEVQKLPFTMVNV